ncbi:hypothetical protein NC239_05650 [Streptomyces sp. G3]|uniref:Uncharacterized protein n=1 Tax=Streptomyces salinarius TaxID=2762598 RepID=A0ABW8BCJ4_9ACTN|nr:hypothetical protein [Streptomyces sp. G3]MCM1937699.1 hypothetical protein [Streptomyces sp. G3]
MLIARSLQEAHLYIDLHPCACGAEQFAREHRLEDHDGALTAVFEGTCPQCGRARSFAFRMADELPPAPPAFGGEEPSSIVDPGEFMWVSDEISTESGLRLLNTAPAEHRAMRPSTAYAIAALEEVAKFLPPGGNRVPEDRFVSERGRALYAKDPERFTREEIGAALELKRSILAGIDHFSPPRG